MTGANDRTGVGAGSGEWQTPVPIYRNIDSAYQFQYDAFASHLNHLAPLYSTAEGTFRCVKHHLEDDGCHATRHEQVSDLTGLTYPRAGLRTFFNPPFTRGIIEDAVKVAAECRKIAAIQVGVLPAATDTDWFMGHVAYPVAHLDFTKRIKFIHPPTPCGEKCSMGRTAEKGKAAPHVAGQPTAGAPGGHVVAHYRREWLR